MNSLITSIKKFIYLYLFPIKRHELKFFIPMALIMFSILFNFSALRSLKDGLVVPEIGAEVISFLKLWLVLPSAVLFTFLYAKLTNVVKLKNLFYVITSFFLIFYFVFAFFIYPNQEYFHPNIAQINNLISSYPHFKWWFKIYSKWSYAIMYVFSELWSAVVINLLFWQFANQIVSSEDARRFYPTFGFIGNMGLILSGSLVVYFAEPASLPADIVQFIAPYYLYESEITLKMTIMVIIFFGAFALCLYSYLNNVVIKDENIFDVKLVQQAVSKTNALPFKESFKLILQSRYIGLIVILVLCYGLAINIIEGPWKNKIRELYPSTKDYIIFMGEFNKWMGIGCVTIVIFSSNFIRRFSWLSSALITPLMIAITGSTFFIFVIFGKNENININDYVFNPIFAAVLLGSLQNILSKASKYSLFDSTKEMAYIPLSTELKVKGKATAEVIGTKLGKSLGAFIQSSLFIIFPSACFDDITPILMGFFIAVIIIWVYDIFTLNKAYNKLVAKK